MSNNKTNDMILQGKGLKRSFINEKTYGFSADR